MKKLRLLSLFSGCGGMDIGFEGNFEIPSVCINKTLHNDWVASESDGKIRLKETCFETVFANDIRADAKSAWVSYFKQKKSDANSLYRLDSIVDLVKQSDNGSFIFPQNIDIVTGGFPCQDFSIAGKREGFNSLKSHSGGVIQNNQPTRENRGHLYFWMREVISRTLPKLFIAENVKGLTNLKDVKEIIQKDFSQAGPSGYMVIPAKVLFAPDYGIPQSRERVIFIGFRQDLLKKKAIRALSKENIPQEYDPYPEKTHGNKAYPYVTCNQILSDLEEPEKSSDLSQQKYSKAKYMGKHCQGQSEIKWDSYAPTIRSEHHGNIEYRRLSLEHGGQLLKELEQGLKERRLTVRECARIQTFPDDYQFILKKTPDNVAVSSSDAYKIIGNAVPCLLAYSIAKNLEVKWKNYFGD